MKKERGITLIALVITIINLTEIFGSGNEPTKEQMDEIFSDF